MVKPLSDRAEFHDVAWFNGLFDRFYLHVRNFSFRLLGDMEAAQEVAQDVFVRLWEKGDRRGDEHSVRSFLFTAARNLCIDRIRSQRTLSEYRRKIMLKYSQQADPDQTDISDLLDVFDRQIDALPAQCGTAFRLSRIENLKYKEIAQRMGISVKTVEAHISRAIAILRTRLGEGTFLTVISLLIME